MKTLAFLLLVAVLDLILCQRNAREEAICAPFLTSKATSPLIPNLARNLTVDDDGEFSCELVLQDVQLPAQIRFTIHEGLHHLAVRHVQMGLHKARSAAKHAKVLAEMQPRSADFHLMAGKWTLHPDVGDSDRAAFHFREVLRGNASEQLADQQRYTAWRGLVQALSYSNQPQQAVQEALGLLEAFPYDLEMVFLLKDHRRLLPSHLLHRALTAIQPADRLYQLVDEASTSSYEGFVPSTPWEVPRHAGMLSAQQLTQRIQRREPFVISLGSVQAMAAELQWGVSRWVEEEGYLAQRVAAAAGHDLDGQSLVLVESPQRGALPCSESANQSNCYAYGHGLFVKRSSRKFPALLSTPEEVEEDAYVNVQLPGTGKNGYNPPLHLIQEDLPLLHDMFDAMRANVTDINLWMGIRRSRSSTSAEEEVAADGSPSPVMPDATTSRLHRDALDNLYFVVQGRKRFMVWDPSAARAMRTLAPSFAISRDGLQYQLEVHQLHAALQGVSGLQGETGDVLKELLASPMIRYETDSLHFSQLLSSLQTQTDLPQPTAVIELGPGDILYLPTGWFHHVTSFAERRHMAVNVWWRALNWMDAEKNEKEQVAALVERLLSSARQ